MKNTCKLAALMAAFLMSSPAWSGSNVPVGNPLMRVCYNAGGDFLVLDPGTVQDLPMCVFGEASIGAQAFLDHVSGQQDDAVNALLSAESSVDPSEACSQAGAQELSGQDPQDGQAYDLCRFSDGSLIDAATLARGSSDPANSGLLEALR